MKKEFRIKRNEEFQEIIEKRIRVSSAVFVVYYRTNEQKHLRIGISVGKKLGNAVERNLVKRQLRAMIRENLNFSCPYDLIIIVRPDFRKQSFDANRKDLLHLIKKIKIEEQYSLIRKETI